MDMETCGGLELYVYATEVGSTHSGGMFGMDLAWLLYHMQGLSTHIGVHDVKN